MLPRPRGNGGAEPERRGRPGRKRGRRPALSLWFPSQTEFLGLVRELARKMAQSAGFDAAQSDRLALAVDEAATNVIEHAYHGAAGHQVEVRFEDQGPEFRVELLDSGEMVDPKQVPRFELQKSVDERRTGGMGVHLMERIMDSVTFRRTARRNVCCLVKKKV